MVYGVCISTTSVYSEFQIPAKTSDVLEWIRKKYKNSEIQFQGKIQDPLKETRWLCVFASVTGDDDNVNSHMLPSPFDEETYYGPILILSSKDDNQDSYQQSVASYENIRSEEYETLYSEWTFAVDDLEEEDEIEEEAVEEDEEEEEEEPEEEVEEPVQTTRPSKSARPAVVRFKRMCS
jgi:cobalamin biosynthesis protein CobT